MEHHAETDRLQRETFGVAGERYDGEALIALEPALKPGLAGGWHYRTDAHLRPDRLLTSWRRVLETKGVTFREDCEVKGLLHGRDRAMAVCTNQGEVEAEAFVIATGAWTPLLEHQLGCRIPIQPGKGYSITMPRPAVCPVLPLLLEEHRVAVTPMRSGYRIGSMMEFSGYDATLDRRRLDILKRGAACYLREPVRDPVEEEWFGWRPMTPDGKPIIDRSPVLNNVVLAVGHNMLGLSMAPATGKVVAEMLSGSNPHVDVAPYALRRWSLG
jgi:D-amino-acid dehydrogenase